MKTLIKILICLSLIYTPMFANAANVGGWTLGGGVAQGASTVYEGTKKVVIDGVDYIKKGTAVITPTATGVAKVLARGAAGYALSVAVEQLLGAVDWVLDPANNQIVYTPNADPSQPNPNIPKIWLIQDKFINPNKVGFSNVAAACNFLIGKKLWSTSPKVTSVDATESGCMAYNNGALFGSVSVVQVANPAYDPAKEEKKTLPLETVAQKVISNAESGDTNAQVATTAAAADIVAEAEKDDVKARPIAQQLEASAQTKPADEAAAEKANEAQGQSKPNTQNPEAMDLSLEFPVFCGWAPLVCEAAQTVISFPQTLTGWWESANQKADDWVTSISDAYQDFMRDDDLPNDDTTLDVSEIPTPELQENAISWGASCPADVQIPINLQGVSSTITFSWSPWCQLLDIIKPAIIASAYIGAAFIVLGLRT